MADDEDAPRTPWCLLLGSTAGYYGSSVSVILFNKWVMSCEPPPPHGPLPAVAAEPTPRGLPAAASPPRAAGTKPCHPLPYQPLHRPQPAAGTALTTAPHENNNKKQEPGLQLPVFRDADVRLCAKIDWFYTEKDDVMLIEMIIL